MVLDLISFLLFLLFGGNFFTKISLDISLTYFYTRVIYCFSFPRERKLNALADCILNISRGR